MNGETILKKCIFIEVNGFRENVKNLYNKKFKNFGLSKMFW